MSENKSCFNRTAPARWQAYLLLALALWLTVPPLYVKATSPQGLAGWDLRLLYAASRRLMDHQPLYQFDANGITYVNPPVVAMLFCPLAAVPFPVAVRFWAAINITLIFTSIVLFLKAARRPLADPILLAILAILSLSFWPLNMTVWFGQTNCILLAMLSGIYWADSRNRPVTLGLLIGSAACVKLWMLGLLLLPLYRREWRAAGSAILLFIAVVGISFTLVGWREWSLFQRLIGGYAAQQLGQHYGTQSFIGFARVHFSRNTHFQPISVAPWIRPLIILSGFTMMGAGWLTLFLRRFRSGRNDRDSKEAALTRQLEVGLATITLLLSLPMCETHYFILCLPLFWTWVVSPGRFTRKTAPWVISAGLIYSLYTHDWPSPLSGPASLFASMEFFSGVMLWLLTFSALVWVPDGFERRRAVPAPF